MARTAEAPAIMFAAGEASGDLHGAMLCRHLRARAPAVRLFGMGGARMAKEGLEVLADVTRSAVVGGSEALRRLPVFWRAFRRLRAALETGERPSALVLIDFPDFNLRLARVARAAGVPVVYFMPPQIWAWRSRRIHTLRRLVSLVIAAFPFEVSLYRSAGIPVAFVGHPLLDGLADAPSRTAARRALGIDAEAQVVGLLPGSRPHEIARILPVMRGAAARLARDRPDTRFILAAAPTVEAAALETALTPGAGGAPSIAIVADATYAVLRAADVLLVTSGTATLEAALLGTPMVVCYRVSASTALVARLLIRIPWISLPNIVLGWQAVPEVYGRAATAERLAHEVGRLLELPGARAAQRAAFDDLADVVGEPGVGGRAADLVLATAARCR